MELEHPDITKMNLWGTLEDAPCEKFIPLKKAYVFHDILPPGLCLTKKEINGIIRSWELPARKNARIRF